MKMINKQVQLWHNAPSKIIGLYLAQDVWIGGTDIVLFATAVEMNGNCSIVRYKCLSR